MDNKSRKAQEGFTLILIVFLVVLAAGAYLASALNSNMINTDRDIRTTAALAQAKEALINWSVANSTMPGTLPCPDTDNSGTDAPSIAAQQCVAQIGHLPWQTLGLSDIRDGYGECLWYALTPVYGDAIPTTPNRIGQPVNKSVAGTITIESADGVSPLANNVIAVIIAPGAAVSLQDRSNAGNKVCGGNTKSNNYLDTAQNIDNSVGNIFIAGTPSATFNDKLVYITAQEFYQAVSKRIAREMLGNINGSSLTGHAGPVAWYDANVSYPCPLVAGASNCTPGVSGIIDPTGLQYNNVPIYNWLTNNNWFATEAYAYTTPTHVKVTVAYPTGSYSCDANANIFACSSP